MSKLLDDVRARVNELYAEAKLGGEPQTNRGCYEVRSDQVKSTIQALVEVIERQANALDRLKERTRELEAAVVSRWGSLSGRMAGN